MQLQSFAKHRVDLIGAAIALILLCAMGQFINHVATARANANAFAQRAAAAVTSTQDTRRAIAALDTDSAVLRQGIAVAHAALHRASELNQRLDHLTALASRFRLAVDGVEPGAGRQQRYWIVPIQMSGRGTYPEIVTFLHTLNASMPDMSVTAVSLNAAPGGRAGFRIELAWKALPPGEVPQSTVAPGAKGAN